MKFTDFKKKVDDEIAAGALESESQNERVKNLEVILDIVKSINRTLIIDDVLELVLKNAIKLTNSERGFIVLKNNSTGELEFKLGLDSQNNRLPENFFRVSTTILHDVFITGLSKFIEGAQSDTNYDPSKSILRLELQTILCSPLITDEKKIGVIYVDSRQLNKIKIREITDTFEILAGQAAIAIRNAQLYDGQVNAYNALNEANAKLILAERKALKSSIDSEIGGSLQGLVHLALLETESLLRTVEKTKKEIDAKPLEYDSIIFDRLQLKSKVAIDSIRNIQKYAQALVESSIMNLNKDKSDINKTIQSVIKYLSAMKRYNKIIFKTVLNAVPLCSYDAEQIQHLLVHLFSNSAEAKNDAEIVVKSSFENNNISVTVEDNGPGFTPGNNDSYFELPSPQKPGYGLFLCKSIIDRHNGSIGILDNPNGATVKFTLPLVK
jgi:signal transduction histidine kinase